MARRWPRPPTPPPCAPSSRAWCATWRPSSGPPPPRASAFATATIADDITGGRQWFRRRALPSRPTWNVVAEAGDRDYPEAFREHVAGCARRAGVHLRRGLRFRNATDALVARRAGYPTVVLGSINRYKLPSNYHWPTDVPDNVDFSTTADAVGLCHEVVQSLAVRPGDRATHRK